MNAIPLILMAGVGLFVFYALHASERYRADAIRALATRSGMHCLGKALPMSLTLEGTPFHSFSKVWNVIDGEPRGTRIMAFDCQVGVGRGSWRRSVIAVGASVWPIPKRSVVEARDSDIVFMATRGMTTKSEADFSVHGTRQ